MPQQTVPPRAPVIQYKIEIITTEFGLFSVRFECHLVAEMKFSILLTRTNDHQGQLRLHSHKKYIENRTNVRVVMDAVSVMAAYAAITLTASILVHWYQICNLAKEWI